MGIRETTKATNLDTHPPAARPPSRGSHLPSGKFVGFVGLRSRLFGDKALDLVGSACRVTTSAQTWTHKSTATVLSGIISESWNMRSTEMESPNTSWHPDFLVSGASTFLHRLPGFHLGMFLMQGVTFTGTMLEVKKTHVLVVLDLQQNADLQKFMKGAAGHGHAFRACMH